MSGRGGEQARSKGGRVSKDAAVRNVEILEGRSSKHRWGSQSVWPGQGRASRGELGRDFEHKDDRDRLNCVFTTQLTAAIWQQEVE